MIKLAHHPIRNDGDASSRLVQEGQILSSVRHEALARVIDLGTFEGRPYLVLEFIEGDTI